MTQAAPLDEHARDCAVCLAPALRGDELVVLPCDPRHRLHRACAVHWLSKSAACPLCRADVGTLLRARADDLLVGPPAPPATEESLAPSGSLRQEAAGLNWAAVLDATARSTGSHLGVTPAGGVVRRYESRPPTDWERPVYIPQELWPSAQYFEVVYPGHGEARIWRVPASAQR